ncbi:MAG: DUF898 family protein [Pseudomonadota bacterium]
MTGKRRSQEYEPIADLFGDVVRDGPPFLYDAEIDLAGRFRPPPLRAPASESAQDPTCPDADLALRMQAEIEAARAAAAVAATGAHRDAAVEHRDDNGLLSAVVVLHGALTVLSLGLYSFWLKTQQRRVLWSHTRLEGDPLDYTGRGRELLLRFLAALVVVAAFIAAAFVAVIFAVVVAPEVFGPGQRLNLALAGLPALTPLPPVLAFLSRRYRLSRTRWRGVRFGMDGSPLSILGLWLLWAAPVALSAGLLFPFWRWARERRLTRAVRWGEARLGFEGSPWPLFLHWAPLWLAFAGGAALLAAPGLRETAGIPDPGLWVRAFGPIPALLGAAGGAMILGVLACNYRAAEIRLFWNARRLGGAQGACDFSVWHLVDAFTMVLARNIWPGLLIYLAIALIAWIPLSGAMEQTGSAGLAALPEAVRDTLLARPAPWRDQAQLLVALAAAGFLAAVFAIWLRMAVFARTVHMHLCDSLRVMDAQRLAAADPQPADWSEDLGR